MLQASGCHLAVMVLYVALSLDAWVCQHLPKSSKKTWTVSMRG